VTARRGNGLVDRQPNRSSTGTPGSPPPPAILPTWPQPCGTRSCTNAQAGVQAAGAVVPLLEVAVLVVVGLVNPHRVATAAGADRVLWLDGDRSAATTGTRRPGRTRTTGSVFQEHVA
jgi:hypothetical protein